MIMVAFTCCRIMAFWHAALVPILQNFFARNWLLKLEKGSCGLKYFNLSIDLNGANGLSSKYASHPASMLSKYN